MLCTTTTTTTSFRNNDIGRTKCTRYVVRFVHWLTASAAAALAAAAVVVVVVAVAVTRFPALLPELSVA